MPTLNALPVRGFFVRPSSRTILRAPSPAARSCTIRSRMRCSRVASFCRPQLDGDGLLHLRLFVVLGVVETYAVPTNLKRRFEWLSAGDVHRYETLFNYFLQRERQLVTSAVAAELVSVQRVATDPDAGLQAYSRQVEVGGHQVSLNYDPRAVSVSVERTDLRRPWSRAPLAPSGSVEPDVSERLGLVIVVLVLFVLMIRSCS